MSISVRSRGRQEELDLEEFERRVRDGRIVGGTEVRWPVVTGARWARADELDLFKRLYAPGRIQFARAFSLSRFPYFTASLCAFMVAWFMSLAGPERFIPLDPLIESGAKVRPNIIELGQTWRLLTANLLHRDILHLIFNIFFLFNLGGTMENAFRLRDYGFVLVCAALSTTSLSVLMSGVPSVGASGMILGLFGAASVFGIKYGPFLPRRYQRYFGSAVLPYAVFILYVGLVTPDTDNWGHLGGLLGGAAASIPLRPRIWQGRPTFWARFGTMGASVTLVGTVLLAGPVLRRLPPAWDTVEEPRSGIAFSYPPYWESGHNHLGYAAKGNRLGTSLGIRAETREFEPYSLREVRRWFVQDQLKAFERRGELADVRIVRERPISWNEPGVQALELEVHLESRAGPQVTRNLLIARGYYRYAVVVSAPRAWAEPYGPILQTLLERVELRRPEPLAQALAMARRFPNMTSTHVRLGQEWARVGRVTAAQAAWERALETAPDHIMALYGLAKLAADFGGELAQAEQIATDLVRRRPEEPAFAALLADLRERLGRLDGACQVLQSTFDRLEDPPEELRERLVHLRCFRRF